MAPKVLPGISAQILSSIPNGPLTGEWFRQFTINHLQNADVRNATAGTGIDIAASIGSGATISSTASGGTVTSVGVADTSATPIYAVSGSPITGAGTIDLALLAQSANLLLAGPSVSGSAPPTFRALVFADLPAVGNDTVLGNASGSSAVPSALNQAQLTALINAFTASLSGAVPASGGGTSNYLRADGTWDVPPGTGAGTVTSVGIADSSTSPLFAVSGSPVTGSGTIDLTLETQTKNLVFAGPTSGAAAQPTFRGLALADFPTIASDTVLGNVTAGTAVPTALTQAQLTALINAFTSSLSGAVPASGGGTNNYLRADGTWDVPPGTGGASSANPSASVGLTAVNGTALTFMTSDSAPPLSQAIVPTWTGKHTFSPASGNAILVNAVSGSAGIEIVAAASSFASLVLQGGRTGTKSWELIADAAVAGTWSVFSDSDSAELVRVNAGKASPVIQAWGPVAAALVDMTPDKGTFTLTAASGISGSGTAIWTRNGNQVTLFFPVITNATSSGTGLTFSGLPAAIQPARAFRVKAPDYCVENNGAFSAANGIEIAFAASSGTITFLLQGSASGWSGTVTRGIATAFCVSYPLN